MRTLALTPVLIALAATTVLAQSEIYSAARADGKDGTGAAGDPRNASTQRNSTRSSPRSSPTPPSTSARACTIPRAMRHSVCSPT